MGVTAANVVPVLTSPTEEDVIKDARSEAVDDEVCAVDEVIVARKVVDDVVAKLTDEVGAGGRLGFAELDDDADMDEAEEDAEEDAEDADETDGVGDGTELDVGSNRTLVTRVVGATAADEDTAMDEITEFDIGVAEFTEVVGAATFSGNA